MTKYQVQDRVRGDSRDEAQNARKKGQDEFQQKNTKVTKIKEQAKGSPTEGNEGNEGLRLKISSFAKPTGLLTPPKARTRVGDG
jgi:hypothetical protein